MIQLLDAWIVAFVSGDVKRGNVLSSRKVPVASAQWHSLWRNWRGSPKRERGSFSCLMGLALPRSRFGLPESVYYWASALIPNCGSVRGLMPLGSPGFVRRDCLYPAGSGDILRGHRVTVG